MHAKMELGALMYGNFDGLTKKAALRFLSARRHSTEKNHKVVDIIYRIREHSTEENHKIWYQTPPNDHQTTTKRIVMIIIGFSILGGGPTSQSLEIVPRSRTENELINRI